jgi:hypothetical protein
MEWFHGTELRRNGNLAMGVDWILFKTEVLIIVYQFSTREDVGTYN